MKKQFLAAAAAALCAAGGAHAAIIPVLLTVTPEGDLFRYTYQGSLAGDQGLAQGSKLVIFDFAGFAGGLQAPTGFAATTQLSSGLFAPGQTDDPGVANLVFTWNGPDFQTSGGPFATAQFNGLSALSTFDSRGLDGFASIAVTNNGAAAGTQALDAGSVDVPVAGSLAVVPEPAAWGLMIVGFGGVGALARRRRRLGEAGPSPRLGRAPVPTSV
jgi:hypothetical protein